MNDFILKGDKTTAQGMAALLDDTLKQKVKILDELAETKNIFKLPKVNWQDKNWAIPGQIKKILEEAGEVAEAIAEEDPVNTIREALDTMQTCATLIDMVQAEWDMPIERFLEEHVEKLERKGYL